MEIETSQDIMGYVVKKGSVAVDGISLTVVNVFRDSFTVVIIPHTEKVTTFGSKRVHDTVNLETDIIGKYVAKFLLSAGYKDREGRLLKKLSESGFL
jgi:riboflavin synthase